MITINEHYLKLQASYLFSDIAKRVSSFQENNPDMDVIKLGIGDVTRALPAACTQAFHDAVDEMAQDSSFRGYGPEQGYAFLREAIAENDFQSRGADIKADEIFVSDGAKCDTGNIQELFSQDITIAIPDPVYPAAYASGFPGRSPAIHIRLQSGGLSNARASAYASDHRLRSNDPGHQASMKTYTPR